MQQAREMRMTCGEVRFQPVYGAADRPQSRILNLGFCGRYYDWLPEQSDENRNPYD